MASAKARAAEDTNQADETIANLARRMAGLIPELPDELVRSFAREDAQQRVDQLTSKTFEIKGGLFDVVVWVEQHRHPDTAVLLKDRLLFVTDEYLQLAELDIPEFAGGIRTPPADTPSDGLALAATLKVTATLFAKEISAWADTIEQEDRSHEAADASDGPDDKQRLTTRKRKRPGRPKPDPKTVKSEAKLFDAWCRARDSGTYKGDFADDNEMKLPKFQQLLERVRSRKRRSRKDK